MAGTKQFTYTDIELIDATKRSKTLYQVVRELGLQGSGAAVKRVRSRIVELNLDVGHFWTREERYKALGHVAAVKRIVPYEKVFCENSAISQTNLVKKYKALGVPYVCNECGQLPTHNNKPLVLQLDHKNGVKNDNRYENLRWLCPNCHTQTDTFTSRNNGNVPRHLHHKRKQKELKS